MKRAAILAFLLFSSINAFAQPDTTMSADPEVRFEGFADIFYAYDFNKPTAGYRQPFLYNHNRHNEFNLNLALLKSTVQHTRYRGAIALQAGTYAQDNYAAEEDLLKHVFEANAGIALDRQAKVWLDAGILASHIGFESAISSDNLTLTRSLLAENSPYYLAGAKVSYNPTPAWTLAALVVNGWQRIKRVPGNSLPCFGTQVSYAPSENLALNWSTFLGTDDPDDTRRMRYFNNLYGKFSLNQRTTLIAGFDIGIQQQSKGISRYNTWYSPVVIAQYKMSETWAIAGRAEYYSDRNEVIISAPGTNGFKATGLSANADYTPSPNIVCRLEARWLKSQDDIFEKGSSYTDSNFALISSIAIRLKR
ncbi:MAG: porin [Hymenobacteraceae bacterium]|nr:porin [Hymenobacteraceae bacterium]